MQHAKATLYVPESAFPKAGQTALSLHVTFNGVTFKSFVLIASLAKRIAEGDESIKQLIERIDSDNLEQTLKSVKGLFYFHTRGSHTDAVCVVLCDGWTRPMLVQISLETLSLDLKSAGNFTLEMEVRHRHIVCVFG